MTSTLKVQNIAHTGGTTGLTIDSNGYVLTPNRPAAQVSTLASNLTTAGNIVFTTVVFDTTSMYSNGLFTAPIAGKYFVTYTFLSAGSGSGSYAPNTRVYKNGVDVGYGAAHTNLNDALGNGGTNYIGISASLMVDCSVNDTISIYNQNSNTPIYNASQHCFASVHLVG